MSDTQLCHCATGACGIITRVDGDSHITARLREMGVLPGQWVRMIKPGNPVIFQVGDSRLCVRANQLKGVSVDTLPETSHERLSRLELAFAAEPAGVERAD